MSKIKLSYILNNFFYFLYLNIDFYRKYLSIGNIKSFRFVKQLVRTLNKKLNKSEKKWMKQ